MIKSIIGFLVRLALLYIALPFLLMDMVLVQTAVPRLIFQWQPFIHSSLIVLVIVAAISVYLKSKTPLIWAAFCLSYAAAFFASLSYSIIVKVAFSGITLLIAFSLLVGAISFLFRNKFIEPLLVLLPICAGAWSYISIIYLPYLVAWVEYTTGKRDAAALLSSAFGNLSTGLLMTAIVVVPTFTMYFLGKHGYLKIYQDCLSRKRRAMALRGKS